MAEIEVRYGKPLSKKDQGEFSTSYFQFNQFVVGVTFAKGRSSGEILAPSPDENKVFSDQESLTLIKAVSGIDDWKLVAKTALTRRWMSKTGVRAEREDSLLQTKSISVITPELALLLHKADEKEMSDLANKFGGTPAATTTTISQTEKAKPENQADKERKEKAAAEESARAMALEKKARADKATFQFHSEQAAAGNVGSMYRLGQLYLAGTGCEANTNQAKLWFKKAADAGNTEAAAVLYSLE